MHGSRLTGPSGRRARWSGKRGHDVGGVCSSEAPASHCSHLPLIMLLPPRLGCERQRRVRFMNTHGPVLWPCSVGAGTVDPLFDGSTGCLLDRAVRALFVAPLMPCVSSTAAMFSDSESVRRVGSGWSRRSEHATSRRWSGPCHACRRRPRWKLGAVHAAPHLRRAIRRVY